MILRARKKKDDYSLKGLAEQGTGNLYVSIIIPTYNEEKVIQRKLENTVNLLDPKEKMEIIVVDDGSTDRTLGIARRFNRNLKKKIKIIASIKNKGKPTALNKACKAARGEIIVVTDADVFISKNSLTALLSNFSNQRIGAVCGRETIENPNNNFVTGIEYQYRNLFHMSRVIEKSLGFPPIPFHGGLMAFRKRLYTDLPPDTIGDDHEVAVRVWKSGYDVIYDPSAAFSEYATQSLREIYEQKRRRAQGIVQCILRNRDLLFGKESGEFGRLRFPVLTSEFLVCPFVFFIGITSLVLHTLLFADLTVWLLGLSLILVFMTISSVISCFSKKWYWGIPLAIFGLLIFQVAMVHAVMDILLGSPDVQWKKIDGQRIDPAYAI